MTEFEKKYKDSRKTPCIFWIRKTDMIKMSLSPQMIYRFNAVLAKIPMMFSPELEKKKSYN